MAVVSQFVRTRRRLAELYGDQCIACGAQPDDVLHIDHVVPVKSGGRSHIRNYQLLCSPCNYKKAATYRDYRLPRLLLLSAQQEPLSPAQREMLSIVRQEVRNAVARAQRSDRRKAAEAASREQEKLARYQAIVDDIHRPLTEELSVTRRQLTEQAEEIGRLKEIERQAQRQAEELQRLAAELEALKRRSWWSRLWSRE